MRRWCDSIGVIAVCVGCDAPDVDYVPDPCPVESAAHTGLDIQILLDTSVEMNNTAGDVSEFQAFRTALGAFATAKENLEVGLGLSFFPAQVDTPPCDHNATCGSYGPCGKYGCEIAAGVLAYCDPKDNNCPDTPCLEFGICPQKDELCFVGQYCVDLANPCKRASAYCLNPWSCDPQDHVKAAVEAQRAPTAASFIETATANRFIQGKRNTGPALQGTIELARESIRNNRRKMVIVLASSRPANWCGGDYQGASVAELAAIANAAATGCPPVQVFSLAVLEQDSPLRADFDAIAAAGGTHNARIVDKNGPEPSAQLAQALQSIRSAALSPD